MKLKKILVSILVPLNSVNDINEKITQKDIQEDVLGFHIVLTNNINKKFICDFLINSDVDTFWSIDKKKTINKCLNIEYQIQRCRITIEKNEEKEIFIWSDNGEIILMSLSNNLPDSPQEITSIRLNDDNDSEFISLFGFKKKYHFDQYRKLLIYGLYEQKNIENQRFIVEMIEKIIKDAKSEREFEAQCYSEIDFNNFYNKVFRNLLEENCGILDKFNEYRENIIKKLSSFNSQQNIETKIILGRKDPIIVSKKIDLTPKNESTPIQLNSLFQKNEINKTYSIKTLNDDVFIIHEISKKMMFFEPQYSIILYKYVDIRISDLEQTIEKIINNSYGETFEIVLYLNQFIDIFEKIIKNSDNLFRIKIISPKNSIIKTPNLSDIQKLIIISNFTSCISNHIFLLSIGSIFPKKYINYTSQIINNLENNEILILNNCNILNKSNGKIDFYETNNNKLFNYFIQCMFPVIPKFLCKKLNFKSPIFANMKNFKELKNMLMKNGTINNIIIFTKLPEKYTKEALYIYEE